MLFSTLARYASRSFIWSFAASVGILSIIVAAFDFAELQRRTAGKVDLPYLTKFAFVLLKTPYIVEQILPFLVLIAALFIFWRMNRNSELIVIRAAGVSVWQLVMPVMVTAWIVGALDLFVFNEISSTMMSEEVKMEDTYLGRHRSGAKLIDSGLWLRERRPNHQQAVYRIARVDMPNRELQNLTIYLYENNDRFLGRYDAHVATLEDKKLVLRDVWKIERARAAVQIPQLDFDTTLTPDTIQNTGIHEASLSFWQLSGYVKLLDRSGLRSVKYAMYWHAMIARAIWLGMMVLLAAAFTFRPVRTGRTLIMLVMGIFSGFALYFLRDFAYALGTSGALSTPLAAALPPVLTGIVGATLLLYQEDG
jgi:lipopolysaccharide export system permease protein